MSSTEKSALATSDTRDTTQTSAGPQNEVNNTRQAGAGSSDFAQIAASTTTLQNTGVVPRVDLNSTVKDVSAAEVNGSQAAYDALKKDVDTFNSQHPNDKTAQDAYMQSLQKALVGAIPSMALAWGDEELKADNKTDLTADYLKSKQNDGNPLDKLFADSLSQQFGSLTWLYGKDGKSVNQQGLESALKDSDSTGINNYYLGFVSQELLANGEALVGAVNKATTGQWQTDTLSEDNVNKFLQKAADDPNFAKNAGVTTDQLTALKILSENHPMADAVLGNGSTTVDDNIAFALTPETQQKFETATTVVDSKGAVGVDISNQLLGENADGAVSPATLDPTIAKIIDGGVQSAVNGGHAGDNYAQTKGNQVVQDAIGQTLKSLARATAPTGFEPEEEDGPPSTETPAYDINLPFQP